MEKPKKTSTEGSPYNGFKHGNTRAVLDKIEHVEVPKIKRVGTTFVEIEGETRPGYRFWFRSLEEPDKTCSPFPVPYSCHENGKWVKTLRMFYDSMLSEFQFRNQYILKDQEDLFFEKAAALEGKVFNVKTCIKNGNCVFDTATVELKDGELVEAPGWKKSPEQVSFEDDEVPF